MSRIKETIALKCSFVFSLRCLVSLISFIPKFTQITAGTYIFILYLIKHIIDNSDTKFYHIWLQIEFAFKGFNLLLKERLYVRFQRSCSLLLLLNVTHGRVHVSVCRLAASTRTVTTPGLASRRSTCANTAAT